MKQVRGTRDLLGDDLLAQKYVLSNIERITGYFGFQEWQLPVIEQTDLFSRLGVTSDVVSKEMYSFKTESGDSLSLRPEGTAGVCRALITNGLLQTLPQRVFYQGPMFRHERPQKGRYRQFTQAGIEYFGLFNPSVDAEIIACANAVLNELDLQGKVQLQINSLGDVRSRDSYVNALVDYFDQCDLPEFAKDIVKKNPLRLLDSKKEELVDIIKNAPLLIDHLTENSKDYYDQLKTNLKNYDIKFEENPRMVRGLDYYDHTIFEFVTTELGAQNAVLAGGRYNRLVGQMCGTDVSAIGWAAGVDRLALLVKPQAIPKQVVVVISNDHEDKIPEVLMSLRTKWKYTAIPSSKVGVKGGLTYANKIGAMACVIIDQDGYQVKRMSDGYQFICDFDEQNMADRLADILTDVWLDIPL